MPEYDIGSDDWLGNLYAEFINSGDYEEESTVFMNSEFPNLTAEDFASGFVEADIGYESGAGYGPDYVHAANFQYGNPDTGESFLGTGTTESTDSLDEAGTAAWFEGQDMADALYGDLSPMEYYYSQLNPDWSLGESSPFPYYNSFSQNLYGNTLGIGGGTGTTGYDLAGFMNEWNLYMPTWNQGNVDDAITIGGLERDKALKDTFEKGLAAKQGLNNYLLRGSDSKYRDTYDVALATGELKQQETSQNITDLENEYLIGVYDTLASMAEDEAFDITQGGYGVTTVAPMEGENPGPTGDAFETPYCDSMCASVCEEDGSGSLACFECYSNCITTGTNS